MLCRALCYKHDDHETEHRLEKGVNDVMTCTVGQEKQNKRP